MFDFISFLISIFKLIRVAGENVRGEIKEIIGYSNKLSFDLQKSSLNSSAVIFVNILKY